MYKYTYFYGLKTSYLSISAARPARFSFYSLGQPIALFIFWNQEFSQKILLNTKYLSCFLKYILFLQFLR